MTVYFGWADEEFIRFYGKKDGEDFLYLVPRDKFECVGEAHRFGEDMRDVLDRARVAKAHIVVDDEERNVCNFYRLTEYSSELLRVFNGSLDAICSKQTLGV